MKIIPICPSSFASNTYLIVSSSHALAVDPSVSVAAIDRALEAEGATLEGILLTHGHFDHMISVESLITDESKSEKPKIYIHSSDAELLCDGRKNAFYEFFGLEHVFPPADVLLEDGDIIPLGDEEIRVIHTPGHTRGSVCYLCGAELISGDTLFSNSYGRCDLYGGDIKKLAESLGRLRGLDPSLTIYPGHGASSLLGSALDNVAYSF